MLRNRLTGPTPLEREEHCGTRAISGLVSCLHRWQRSQTRDEKRVLVVGVDYRYLWNRSAENAGDVVAVKDYDGDPLDSARTSPQVLCGRNSRGGWSSSYLLQIQGNSERHTAVLSNSCWLVDTSDKRGI